MNRFSHVDLAPPCPPPQGGAGGGRSAWLRCGASSVMKVREGARHLSDFFLHRRL